MSFRDKQEWEKRYWIPESVWPLFKYTNHDESDYEEGIANQKSFSNPEISIFLPSDEDNDQKAFDYSDVMRLIQDGVLDNLVPHEEGRIGISKNDERALAEFIRKAGEAWWQCVDRLAVNRIVETRTTHYKIDGRD